MTFMKVLFTKCVYFDPSPTKVSSYMVQYICIPSLLLTISMIFCERVICLLLFTDESYISVTDLAFHVLSHCTYEYAVETFSRHATALTSIILTQC